MVDIGLSCQNRTCNNLINQNYYRLVKEEYEIQI